MAVDEPTTMQGPAAYNYGQVLGIRLVQLVTQSVISLLFGLILWPLALAFTDLSAAQALLLTWAIVFVSGR